MSQIKTPVRGCENPNESRSGIYDRDGEPIVHIYNHELRERLISALNDPQWQPIETAPRDTYVLGFYRRGQSYYVSTVVKSVHGDWAMWTGCDGALDDCDAPDMWMPHPAPPAPEPDAEQTAVGLLRELFEATDAIQVIPNPDLAKLAKAREAADSFLSTLPND